MKTQILSLIMSILIFVFAIVMLVYYTEQERNMNETQSDTIECATIEEILVEEPWWTEDELDILAAVIYYEAGDGYCTDRHQQLVGQVVINRVNSHEFPDTIYDVVTQKNQYASAKMALKNMGNRDIITKRCYDNALAVLNGEVDCPSDIVWQAEFIQGEIYETYDTPYSTTYFCHRYFVKDE